MNISYKIENYYPHDSRCFVIYEAEGFEPLGGWVYVPEEATDEQIHAAVLAMAPTEKWRKGQNMSIGNLIGKTYSGTEQPAPPPVEPVSPEADVVARSQRNLLLRLSDWTQLPDSPANSQEWAVYRQALRDITLQEGFPSNIEWPQEPTTS